MEIISNPIKMICTHNGKFHADEVTAYTILSVLFPSHGILRTRDEEKIKQCEIVIDVGKIYDPDNDKFDHHQKGCEEYFNKYSKVLLSSAGMVYKKYGKQFIEKIVGESDHTDRLYNKLYEMVIKEIDAIDNGQPMCKSKDRLYQYSCNLTFVVSAYNSIDVNDENKQLSRFIQASNYVLQTIQIIIKNLYDNMMLFEEDYKVISKAFENRTNDESYIVVDYHCTNWAKCIFKYENDNNISDNDKIKFVIYECDNVWRIRAIQNIIFVSRKNLLPKEDLAKIIDNPDDIVFIHNKLFIGAAKTLQTAKDIAYLSS